MISVHFLSLFVVSKNVFSKKKSHIFFKKMQLFLCTCIDLSRKERSDTFVYLGHVARTSEETGAHGLS
jgi:hypothetical protein